MIHHSVLRSIITYSISSSISPTNQNIFMQYTTIISQKHSTLLKTVYSSLGLIISGHVMLINSFLLTQHWFSVAASDVVKSGSFPVELYVECCDTSLLVTSIRLGSMQICCSPDKSKIDKFVGKSSENNFLYVLLLLDYKQLQPMDDRTSYYSSLNIMKSWRQHHMQNCRIYFRN